MADATCQDCGTDVFRKGPTGFPPRRCPECQRVHRREINRRAEAKRIAADPDRNKRIGRLFMERNPGYRPPGRDSPEYRERNRETARAWRKANPERFLAGVARWNAENPEKVRARHKRNADRRRARLAGADTYLILPSEWRRMVARHRGQCAYCGGAGPLTEEHVVPLSRGGSHGIGNLLPVCGPCNFSKRDLLLVEWRFSGRPGADRIAS